METSSSDHIHKVIKITGRSDNMSPLWSKSYRFGFLRNQRPTPFRLFVTLSYYTCKWKKGETEEGKLSYFERKKF